MSNLMTSMYTGVSGLKVNQSALNTTAHNIANVDTKGFTRQQVLMGDFPYVTIGQSYNSAMQVGLGTDMTVIRQVRDIFADKGYRTESGRLSFYEQQKAAVDEIETVLGELSGTPFKDNLEGLWEALSGMATEPDDLAKRGIFVSTAKIFLNRAQTISKQLQEYQEKLNSKIQENVDRINEIGDQICELNSAIQKVEGSGQQANDYRDTRNMLLDELSQLVKCTYEEDKSGVVTVNVEGVQFVTDVHVFHMKTEKTITEFETDKADEINQNINAIYNELTLGTSINNIKAMDEWKDLGKYGSLSINQDGNTTRVMFNEIQLMQYDSVAGQQPGDKLDFLPKKSDLINVVWSGNGFGDVFRLNGMYNSEANTDIGGLKGLLVARGSYSPNYTDIPLESEYLKLDGTVDKDKFNDALNVYNKMIGASPLVSVQAQFDQLIHSIVTTINDILSPNVNLTNDTVVNMFKLDGLTVTPANAANAVITAADGTIYDLGDNLVVLDIENAPIGMDDKEPDSKETVGEALFNRKNKDRYQKATMTVNEGGNTYTKEVYIYNKEYDTDPYSLFTIDQLEINNEIANDFSKLPLHYNKYSGLYGGVDMKTCQKLLDAWDTKGLKLDPNSLTNSNFQDYYTSMVGAVANSGRISGAMVEHEQGVVNSFDNARQAVAGVSSDDELTNLIKFQHSYNASSRYINAINEMLEHIINRL